MSVAIPIHRIPSEIIREILFLLPKPVWPLQEVCRLWRSVIINTSRFWTDIEIERRPFFTLQTIFTLQARFAERAGVLPLSVEWDLSIEEEEDTEQNIIALGTFFKQAPTSRWRSLEVRRIDGLPPSFFSNGFPDLKVIMLPGYNLSLVPLVKVVSDTSPSLEELHLCGDWRPCYNDLPTLLDRVYYLGLNGISICPVQLLPPNISNIRLAYNPVFHRGILDHIKDLTIDNLDLDHVTSMESPNLEHFEIKEPVRGRLAGERICLPNLVGFYIPSCSIYILDYFDMPKLHTMRISYSKHSGRTQDKSKLLQNILTSKPFLSTTLSSLFILDNFAPKAICNILSTAYTLKEVGFSLEAPQNLKVIISSFKSKAKKTTKTAKKPSGVGKSVKSVWGCCPVLEGLVLYIGGQKENEDRVIGMCESLLETRKGSGLEYIKVVWTETDEVNLLSVI